MRLCATLLLTTLLVQPSLGDQPEFEVLVIGTYHAPTMFRRDSYTPAHIRAALIAAKPDVVAVESHPEWFAKGRFHVVTYEAEGVAVPWARDCGIPVFGVDWKDIEAWERKEEAMALQAARPLQRAFSALASDYLMPGSTMLSGLTLGQKSRYWIGFRWVSFRSAMVGSGSEQEFLF